MVLRDVRGTEAALFPRRRLHTRDAVVQPAAPRCCFCIPCGAVRARRERHVAQMQCLDAVPAVCSFARELRDRIRVSRGRRRLVPRRRIEVEPANVALVGCLESTMTACRSSRPIERCRQLDLAHQSCRRRTPLSTAESTPSRDRKSRPASSTPRTSRRRARPRSGHRTRRGRQHVRLNRRGVIARRDAGSAQSHRASELGGVAQIVEALQTRLVVLEFGVMPLRNDREIGRCELLPCIDPAGVIAVRMRKHDVLYRRIIDDAQQFGVKRGVEYCGSIDDHIARRRRDQKRIAEARSPDECYW